MAQLPAPSPEDPSLLACKPGSTFLHSSRPWSVLFSSRVGGQDILTIFLGLFHPHFIGQTVSTVFATMDPSCHGPWPLNAACVSRDGPC